MVVTVECCKLKIHGFLQVMHRASFTLSDLLTSLAFILFDVKVRCLRRPRGISEVIGLSILIIEYELMCDCCLRNNPE